MLRIQGVAANSRDPDEAAHYELPPLDLRCLQESSFIIFGIFS